MRHDDDYIHDYKDFWADLVEDEQGNLDRDKVARELSDYHFVMGQVSQVYCWITNDRLSKPTYYARDVISVYEENVEQRINDAIDDFLSDYDIPDPRKEETA